jgi:hypothetical protein
MSEVKYHINIILNAIEIIHSNFIDISNPHLISQLESLAEIISQLSIIKITCKRLVELNEYNSEILIEIIDKIENILGNKPILAQY